VIPANDPSPERLMLSREVRQRLSAAMSELSDAERTAFVMRHFEGVSIDEIARVLGRPNGATRHSVFRAVAKLRRALEPVMSEAR
jgi:RNA polymerase sigma-70 factor (ECF subfamily)